MAYLNLGTKMANINSLEPSWVVFISRFGLVKGSFYIAQYPVRWTAKNALYFLPSLADLLYPRHSATAVLLRHKQQWHRHDRRGSAVVPSLIAVALRKTVKTADLRGGTAETLYMFKNVRSATAGWANPQWGRHDRCGTVQ